MKVSVVITLFIFLCYGCQNTPQEKKYYKSESGKHIENEDFEQFSDSFYSDSLFQIQRIIFPLESDRTSEFKDSLDQEGVNSDPVLDKTSWVMLRNNYFKNKDSVVYIKGVKYKLKTFRAKEYCEESIFIENSGFVTTLKFALKNGRWYLVDYIECDN